MISNNKLCKIDCILFYCHNLKVENELSRTMTTPSVGKMKNYMNLKCSRAQK